jgi:hypothetical protein
MAVGALLTGCPGAGDDARPSAGAPRAIAATVQRLERATAERDFATICAELLTASARRRAGGPDCVRLTRSAAAGVERPSVELKAIDIDGARARVTVRTRAAGQVTVGDVLLLRREDGRWRIDSLGG